MKIQAWGWLMAAVAAAGLNAAYHDGGLEWAHRVAGRVGHSSAAVLALASGHAGQFLTEARLITAHEQASPCRLATALARVETKVAGTETELVQFQGLSDREQAQLDRLEANRDRIEAQVEVQTNRINAAMAAFNPVVMKSFDVPTHCPRVRVRVPRMPMVRVPAPVVHVDAVSAGPV